MDVAIRTCPQVLENFQSWYNSTGDNRMRIMKPIRRIFLFLVLLTIFLVKPAYPTGLSSGQQWFIIVFFGILPCYFATTALALFSKKQILKSSWKKPYNSMHLEVVTFIEVGVLTAMIFIFPRIGPVMILVTSIYYFVFIWYKK